jgi:hypothetical protein
MKNIHQYQKGISKIIIVVIIALLVSLGGTSYYLINNDQEVGEEVSNEENYNFGDIDNFYKEQIIENGPNFAGHYYFFTPGCGTMCQQNKYLDLETGEIRTLDSSSVCVDYNIDSNLLIVNSEECVLGFEEQGYPVDIYFKQGETQYLIKDNGELELVFQKNSEALEEENEFSLSCEEYQDYFVIHRKLVDEYEFSERAQKLNTTLIKHKEYEDQNFECEYEVEENDSEFFLSPIENIVDFEGSFMITDAGTGPCPRGLRVYDLTMNKVVLDDGYSSPLVVEDAKVSYWSPSKIEPTIENCPEMVEYSKASLGSGIESHVIFDLDTLVLTHLGEYRCTARQ